MTRKTLVVGATGNVGSGVLAALLARGADVRGLAHSEAGIAAIRQAGAEPAAGELTELSSLRDAFEGVDTAFVVTRGMDNQVEMAANAIEAARRAGVRRIVRLSAFVPEPALRTVLGRQHHEIDESLKAAGVAYTILRPTFFMQNILGAARPIAADGVMYLPFGDGRAGIIDVRDIVDVAVEVLLSAEGHEGRTYTLTGPASISMHDVAKALTRVLGREVKYVDVPVQAGIDSFIAMGMPKFMADTFGELFVNFAQGGADRATGDVEQVTGHPARSIDDFARDFAAAFPVAAHV
jgi:uncharacterized protein YbjT (DUF2867 family)